MEEQLSVSFESAPVRVTSISTDGRTAAESVVEAVSAVAESDPGEMPPLSESIDPDVLDGSSNEMTPATGRAQVCVLPTGSGTSSCAVTAPSSSPIPRR